MAFALYRRYRPDTFDGVIGQEQVTVPLSRALDNDKLTHAYLFSGPRGCGKTSSARILARCINCVKGPTSHPCGECASCKELATGGTGSIDVVEIDAASHNGVDDARELRERAGFAPVRDRYKIFILDEAHMVTQQGFNALLKIVEEPPEHVMFIFATTEPDKVIGTIRSRTHHYPFRLVPPEIMGPYLETICQKEHIELESGVLRLVMRAGGGSVRDTLSVLDQLMVGAEDGRVTMTSAVALLGFTPAALIDQALDAIAQRQGEALYGIIERVVIGGFDARGFVGDLLARVRDLLVLQLGGAAAERALASDNPEDMQALHNQAQYFTLADLTAIAQLLNATLASLNTAISARMSIELLAAQLLARPVSNLASSAPQHLQDEMSGNRLNGVSSNERMQHGSRAARIAESSQLRSQSQPPALSQSQIQQSMSDFSMGEQAVSQPSVRQPAVNQPSTNVQLSNQQLSTQQLPNQQPPSQHTAAPAQGVQLAMSNEQVQQQWQVVLRKLPDELRSYVDAASVSAVQLQARNGHPTLVMTFATPLQQHAFALAVAQDAKQRARKASQLVLQAVREVFGDAMRIMPHQMAANGERVESVNRMDAASVARVKQQIALMRVSASMQMASQLVAEAAQPEAASAASVSAVNASATGGTLGNAPSSAASSVSSAQSAHTADAKLAQSAHAEDAVTAQSTSSDAAHDIAKSEAAPVIDESSTSVAHAANATTANASTASMLYVAGATDADSAASATTSANVAHASNGNVTNANINTNTNTAADTDIASSTGTSTASEDDDLDEYASDDQSLGNSQAMSDDEVAEMFEAKSVEHLAADDPRNPLAAQD